MKNVHFLRQDYCESSLEDLLYSIDTTPFDQQVVMCIDQEGIYTKSPRRPVIDPFLVDGLIYFKRNPECGQIYRLKRLQASLHFSKSVPVAEEIDFRIRYFLGNHRSIPKTLAVECDQNITVEERGLFIHNLDDPPKKSENKMDPQQSPSTPKFSDSKCPAQEELFRDDSSDDDESDDDKDKDKKMSARDTTCKEIPIPRKTKVRVPSSISPEPLKETRIHLEKAIQLGLLKNVEFSEKKRGGSKKSPVMSFGWTQTNANQYNENRQTDSGATGPGLTNVTVDIEPGIKVELMKAMDAAMKCTPKGDMEYNIGKPGGSRNQYRKELSQAMGVKYDKEGKPSSVEIKCEAFTIIIPLNLSAHRDIMNDAQKDMDSVVQINHLFLLQNFKDCMSDDLFQWISANSDSLYFPVSIILYSRKVVGSVSKKLDETKALGINPSPPPRCFKSKKNINPKQAKELGEGMRVLYKCINMAFLDTESQRSTINSLERNGVINPISLRQTIECFELKQQYLYSLVKKEQYERLVFKSSSSAKKASSSRNDQHSLKKDLEHPTTLKEIHQLILTHNFEDPNNPGIVDQLGKRIGSFLNRGVLSKDLLKPLKAFPNSKHTGSRKGVLCRRPNSKLPKEAFDNYKVTDLYLDFAKYMIPSKEFHLNMMEKTYVPGSDNYLEYCTGKSFMFDRLTLAKDFASTCEEYTEDSFREIIHNESLVLNDGVTKKLFIWRDKQRDFTKGMSELCRIIPDPTETFNGPVFKVASGWDKLVSKCHFFELF